jgi:hypothetical protein
MTQRSRDMACTVLAAVGGLTAAGGIAFVFLYNTAVFASSRDGINAAFWTEPVVDPALRAYQHWIHAVLGATMAGWGITIAAMAHVPLRRGERWAWWTLLAAVLIWFIADTAASAVLGVKHNVMINIVAVLGLLLPLLAARPPRG